MCTGFFLLGHSKYKLVIASNRDEFYQRPTLKAHFWENTHIIAGADVAHEKTYVSPFATGQSTPSARSRGTWLGMTRTGKFGLLTNVREDPKTLKADAASRGVLVTDYLKNNLSIPEYINQLDQIKTQFNGYNLMLGDINGEFYYYGNKSGMQRLEKNTLYGMSNAATLLPEWPKVKRGKELISDILEKPLSMEECARELLEAMKDDQEYEDFPVCFDREWERSLCPLFIHPNDYKGAYYGTRTQTIILVNHENECFYLESDIKAGEQTFTFTISNPPTASSKPKPAKKPANISKKSSIPTKLDTLMGELNQPFDSSPESKGQEYTGALHCMLKGNGPSLWKRYTVRADKCIQIQNNDKVVAKIPIENIVSVRRVDISETATTCTFRLSLREWETHGFETTWKQSFLKAGDQVNGIYHVYIRADNPIDYEHWSRFFKPFQT